MSLLQVIVLAVLQGITEFLPISSSAHLALAPWLLGWPDQGLAFDIALHFGTLAAVAIYFFRDWLQIGAQGFGLAFGNDQELRRNPRLLWLLAAASLPVGVFGWLLEDYVATSWRHPLVMGSMLIAVGLLMALAERIGARRKSIGEIGLVDAMAIGFAQALALVPGTSRSGITITAGLFRDIDRPSAARFSFLLSTPAVAAAAAKAFLDLWRQGGLPPEMRLSFAIGIGISALTGCLAIWFLLRFLERFDMKLFICYRVVFGIIVVALALLLGHP